MRSSPGALVPPGSSIAPFSSPAPAPAPRSLLIKVILRANLERLRGAPEPALRATPRLRPAGGGAEQVDVPELHRRGEQHAPLAVLEVVRVIPLLDARWRRLDPRARVQQLRPRGNKQRRRLARLPKLPHVLDLQERQLERVRAADGDADVPRRRRRFRTAPRAAASHPCASLGGLGSWVRSPRCAARISAAVSPWLSSRTRRGRRRTSYRPCIAPGARRTTRRVVLGGSASAGAIGSSSIEVDASAANASSSARAGERARRRRERERDRGDERLAARRRRRRRRGVGVGVARGRADDAMTVASRRRGDRGRTIARTRGGGGGRADARGGRGGRDRGAHDDAPATSTRTRSESVDGGRVRGSVEARDARRG